MSAATATILATVAVGATATTTIVSAKMASSAAKEGVELQKSATDAALAYAKQQDAYKETTEANRYARLQQQTAPYRSAGEAANRRMAELMGQPVPETGSDAPTYPTQPVPGMPDAPAPQAGDDPHGYEKFAAYYAGARRAGIPDDQIPKPPGWEVYQRTGQTPHASGQNQPAGDLILMRAPDGSTKRVPASEEPRWVQKGAQRVNG